MFDTSVVRPRAIAASRSTTLAVSIALHSIVVVAAIALSVSSTAVPADPPRQIELYRPVMEPVSPPPPKFGRPPEPHPAQTPPAPPRVEPVQDVAPQTLPDEVRAVPATGPISLTPATTTDTAGAAGPIGDPNGVVGGVDNGQRGGTGTGEGAAHGPYTAGVGGVTLPRVLKRVEPRFPDNIRGAITTAIVVVQCVIGTDGRIHDPQVVTSSFAPLNEAVLVALQQWKFEPGMMRGQPVDTYFVLKVRFEVQR